MVSRFGKQAGIVVNSKTDMTCSAHDLRRLFGDQWAQRVVPAVLRELMRHESINTTMRYYVGRKASTTAAILGAAEGRASLGDQSRGSELGSVEQVGKAR